jgi:Zn-dependent protease with chaperone function
VSEAETGNNHASPVRAPVSYLDGTSSRRRDVTLRFATACEILEDGAVVGSWPYTDMRRVDGPTGTLRLMCTSAPLLARLEVRDVALAAEIERRCPKLGADLPGAKGTAVIIGWSVAALVSIVLMVIYAMPLMADYLTPLVPHSVEKYVGQVADNQVKTFFDGKRCENPDGEAAFEKLVGMLREAGGIDASTEASVISNEIANAIALPGGKIYVFEGLVAKAENVDELAGVIAHELGHVKGRDGLRNMIYNGGTSFLIGLLFGDVTGSSAIIFASRELFQASHSRAAERGADQMTIDIMRKLGRSPKPMGEFLLRVTGKEKGKGLALISSHPLSEDRLARMSQQDAAPTAPPLLTATEWAALKAICKAPGRI